MYGWPVRASRFQSRCRRSSPSVYGRTSVNSIPVPRNTERISPPSSVSVARRPRSARVRTCFSSAGGRRTGTSRHRNRAEDLPHDAVGVEPLGLGVERQHDAVAHHVGREILDVLGRDEVALRAERRALATSAPAQSTRAATRRRRSSAPARRGRSQPAPGWRAPGRRCSRPGADRGESAAICARAASTCAGSASRRTGIAWFAAAHAQQHFTLLGAQRDSRPSP